MRNIKRMLGPAIAAIMTLSALALLGVLMTPHWQVEAETDHIRVTERKTAISSRLGRTATEGTYATKQTRVKVDLGGGVSVNAIVRQPEGVRGPVPACLFIHGAGTGKAAEVYGDLAGALASAGITTLVPDKRLDTYTTFHRDYKAMADDYGRSFDLLRSWPGVDPARVGVYAESEGTWISSVMTASRKEVAYSIMTSPPVYPGRSQMAMAATAYLDRVGAPDGIRAVIPKLLGLDLSVLGLEYADFPALSYLDGLTQPLLVNFGTEDVSMPIEQGARELIEKAGEAGNTNVTLRYYPTNHQMRTGSSLSKPGLPLEPHYTHDLEDWINGVAMGTDAHQWATPMVAGSQPAQRFAAPEEMGPGLITSLRTLLLLMAGGPVLLLAALIGSVCLGLAGHERGKSEGKIKPDRTSPGFGRSLQARLWILGIGSLTVLALTCLYAVMVVGHALSLNGLSPTERTYWPALKVAAVILTLILASVLADAISGIFPTHTRAMGSKGQVAGPGHWITFALATAGSALILVVLAFWGLFTI